jgi:hypothetical protein
MSHWPDRFKPAAAAHVHVFAAGLMWTVVGAVLSFVGVRWMCRAPTVAAPLMAAGAVALGLLKSRAVLDRAARNMIHRIQARGDGRCLGGFLSLRSWGFVAGMALVGRLLRGAVGHEIVGFVYLAVGSALVVSSRLLWWAWHRHRTTDSSRDM